MPNSHEIAFDPETIGALKQALEAAWASLSPSQKQSTDRSLLAERILKAAAHGERDLDRLCARALLGELQEPSISVV